MPSLALNNQSQRPIFRFRAANYELKGRLPRRQIKNQHEHRLIGQALSSIRRSMSIADHRRHTTRCKNGSYPKNTILTPALSRDRFP
jgi:hypothetical protein